jgi:hypothetical protein
MSRYDRIETGAIGSRFHVRRMLTGGCVAAIILLGRTVVFGAEYADSVGTFTLPYDETLWSITGDGDGDFSVACRPEACRGVAAACSGSRIWVPVSSVRRLISGFDAEDTARAVIEGLAAEKASSEKERAQSGAASDAADVPPEVVKPYTLAQTRNGHPFYESEYRVSFSGRVTRFLSFSTGARSHSIAIVCHVPEDQLAIWRPRFDALIGGFKPAPDPFWLRWLAYIGL